MSRTTATVWQEDWWVVGGKKIAVFTTERSESGWIHYTFGQCGSMKGRADSGWHVVPGPSLLSIRVPLHEPCLTRAKSRNSPELALLKSQAGNSYAPMPGGVRMDGAAAYRNNDEENSDDATMQLHPLHGFP